MLNNILQLIATLFAFVLVLALTYFVTKWIAKSGAMQSRAKNIKVIETYKDCPIQIHSDYPDWKKAICHWGNQRADHIFDRINRRSAGGAGRVRKYTRRYFVQRSDEDDAFECKKQR